MAGTYADIVQVVVPSQAVAGEAVIIAVTVKNLYPSASIYIAANARVVNGGINIPLQFSGEVATVSPGGSHTFQDFFIMPGSSVTIWVWSFYWSADGQWYQDDQASVSVTLGVKLETLEVDITPVGAGYVTTDPNPAGGYQQWVNNTTGQFPYGTDVVVTAHPYPGYKFYKWSDEIVGGVSYQNPEHVQLMTEHRAAKCHFREEEEADLETLEVDITPIGKGYVETDPASTEGRSIWHNGDTGKFLHGTNVKVTAIPDSGWLFNKWTDEIVGGVSYDNPSYVQAMTEHRAVKLHFVEEDEKWAMIQVGSAGGHIEVDPEPIRKEDKAWFWVYGTRVTLTAVPDAGYVFKQWSSWSEVENIYVNPTYMDMTECRGATARLIVAEFEPTNGEPGFVLIQDVLYPLASEYVGNVEECTFEFSLLPDQIPGSEWFRDKTINAFTEEVEKEGAHMIKLQVYEDTAPVLTKYRIVATCTASPVPWTLIIVAVLVIIFLIALTYVIIQIREFLWGENGEDGTPGLLTGIGEIIPLLMMVMMMSLVMNVMPGAAEAAGRKIREEAPKIAKEVGKKALGEAKGLFKK